MSELTAILDRADEVADQLKALTERANAKTVAPIATQLVELHRFIVADWVRRFGSVDATPNDMRALLEFTTAAQNRIDTFFNGIAGPAERGLKAEWSLAYGVGIEHGLETAPTAPEKAVARSAVPKLGVDHAVEAQRLATLAKLNAAQMLAEGFPTVTRTLKTVDGVVPRLESLNAFQLTRAATTGTTDVAKSTGAMRMWVAERDACVHCLAYAGVTTAVDVFPVGLSFGDKPLVPPGPLTGPALHPHCRCSCELLDPSDLSVSEALKREAKRSILRGFSLPSESEPVRVRAADRLLSQYPGMPKTVEQYAQRAVNRGKFPTRDVPPGA